MQPTFKMGVTQFWKWFSENAARFYETIEAGECPSLADEVSQATAQFIPGLCWVFGPGENGGHSFTVTGEGVRGKQLLAKHWLRQAVELPGWTYYSSRQPSPQDELDGAAIQVGEHETVDTENFLVRTEVDDENEIIHVAAWHPSLSVVPDEHHLQIFFLLLDEALGEFGTEMWIGRIELGPFDADDKTRSLAELPQFITHVNEYHKWNKLPPLETYSVYQFEKPLPGPRGDTIVGTSMIPQLILEHIQNGKLEDNPFEESGASLVYVSLDNSIFPDISKASEARSDIEDALTSVLEPEASGEVLGGAFGSNHSYIELLVMDGSRSHSIIQSKLNELDLEGKYELFKIN